MDATKHIPLVCGDPDSKPATFTRFVLPFAYCLEQAGSDLKPAPRNTYTPIKDDEYVRWRRSYFTSETAGALFDRALWLRLGVETDTKEFNFADGRKLKVALKPPLLVLFEWNGSNKAEGEMDPMRTGFLVLDACFPKNGAGLDNLLELNELFRYYQRPYEDHPGNGYARFFGIPDDKDDEILYFNRWAGYLEDKYVSTGGGIFRLFPEKWKNRARKYIKDPPKFNTGEKEGGEGWIIYSDTRTFVWTCAVLKKGGGTLRERFKPSCPSAHAWEFGHWIKLLNVDPAGKSPDETNKCTAFERDWAEKKTYWRWEEWDSFYGFNYHSGAAILPQTESPPLWRHFRGMYFDMVLVLLYLRVALFSFSTRLTRITAGWIDKSKDGSGREGFERGFGKLRERFAMFTNLYRFPLLSNQQQGIEMYTIAREHLDVDELFDEIQAEINASHEFLSNEEQKEQTRSTVRLTVVATVGLIIALATSFWGMNILVVPHQATGPWSIRDWGYTPTSLVIISMIFLLFVVRYSKCIERFFDRISHKNKKR